MREGRYPREACASTYWYALQRLCPKGAPDIARAIERAADAEFAEKLARSERLRLGRRLEVPAELWRDAMGAFERSVVESVRGGASHTAPATVARACMVALDALQPPGGSNARQVLLRAGRLGRRLRRAKEATVGV